MPTSSAEVLRVVGLTAGYGGDPIIRGVSVSARSGHISAIIGPNGAGKSTLLKAVMGHVRRSEGSVLVSGEEVRHLRADELAKRGVGYVPQVRDVFEPLSVIENLEMGGYAVAHADMPARIEDVLDLFPRLAERRKSRAGNLSGGERKMLAIGRVLMSRPAVLLLDEPTAGLSPQLAHMLLNDHVPKLAQSGVAVVLVEQRATEALRIADTGYVMVGGAVELSGPASELAAREDIGNLFLGRRPEDG
jgi:branched-chain amino acid transport system ATP-binding protein